MRTMIMGEYVKVRRGIGTDHRYFVNYRGYGIFLDVGYGIDEELVVIGVEYEKPLTAEVALRVALEYCSFSGKIDDKRSSIKEVENV